MQDSFLVMVDSWLVMVDNFYVMYDNLYGKAIKTITNKNIQITE